MVPCWISMYIPLSCMFICMYLLCMMASTGHCVCIADSFQWALGKKAAVCDDTWKICDGTWRQILEQGCNLRGIVHLRNYILLKKISLYQSNSILWFLFHMNHAMQHWHLPFLLVLCLLSCLGLVPAGSLLWIGDSFSQMFPLSPLL